MSTRCWRTTSRSVAMRVGALERWTNGVAVCANVVDTQEKSPTVTMQRTLTDAMRAIPCCRAGGLYPIKRMATADRTRAGGEASAKMGRKASGANHRAIALG